MASPAPGRVAPLLLLWSLLLCSTPPGARGLITVHARHLAQDADADAAPEPEPDPIGNSHPEPIRVLDDDTEAGPHSPHAFPLNSPPPSQLAECAFLLWKHSSHAHLVRPRCFIRRVRLMRRELAMA
jgi:hypothetical protein